MNSFKTQYACGWLLGETLFTQPKRQNTAIRCRTFHRLAPVGKSTEAPFLPSFQPRRLVRPAVQYSHVGGGEVSAGSRTLLCGKERLILQELYLSLPATTIHCKVWGGGLEPASACFILLSSQGEIVGLISLLRCCGACQGGWAGAVSLLVWVGQVHQRGAGGVGGEMNWPENGDN